jgi:hypothetical protein
LLQRGVEVAQRLEQKGDAVGRAERAEDGVVEDEERDDALRAVDRRRERGLVVHAQVPGEQHDDGPERLFAHLDKG